MIQLTRAFAIHTEITKASSWSRYSFSPDLKVISGSGSYLDLFSITARTYALCAEEMSPLEVELRGMGGSLGMAGSSLYILLLEDLKGWAWTSRHEVASDPHACQLLSQLHPESVESEERVFGSSMLWTEVLMLGACRFATLLRGLEGARGEVMGPPHQVTIGPRAALVRVMPPIVPLYRFAVVASAAASAEAFRQKKTETRQKIVRGSRKAYREFAEGIGKLAGNTPGDHQKKTRRLAARMPEATGLVGRINRLYPGVRAAESPKSVGEPPILGFFGYD
ncbi:hypothetical protein BHM03_00032065 [Ensete ventricosum]|nr:hypothetical protein BHM03_00032065 [Ensete ventricosum]